LTKQYKGGYHRQSVLSAAGKLSCNKTALIIISSSIISYNINRMYLQGWQHATMREIGGIENVPANFRSEYTANRYY